MIVELRITSIVLIILALALALVLWRVARGPSLPDRVVGLDMMALLTTSFITVYAIDTHQKVFVDVAIVLALISFLGTVGFAQYIERRARDE